MSAKLAAAPTASIPLALEDDAEVQAAYRLVNNPRVTFEAVLAPHIEATVASARKVREILLVHDTNRLLVPDTGSRGKSDIYRRAKLDFGCTSRSR